MARKKKTMWKAKTKNGNTTTFKIMDGAKMAMTTYKTKTGKKVALLSASKITTPENAAKMMQLTGSNSTQGQWASMSKNAKRASKQIARNGSGKNSKKYYKAQRRFNSL